LAQSRALLAEAIAKQTNREVDHLFALHAVWFPREADARASAGAPSEASAKEALSVSDAPLDARFGGHAELAMFRSAWHDPRALFAGFKAGRNDVAHAHLDLGSFVLDADGVRWAQDLGADDYYLSGYFDLQSGQRWLYYRLNNRS